MLNPEASGINPDPLKWSLVKLYADLMSSQSFVPKRLLSFAFLSLKLFLNTCCKPLKGSFFVVFNASVEASLKNDFSIKYHLLGNAMCVHRPEASSLQP